MRSYFKYFLLAVFLVAIFLIVVIQYITNRSTDQLVSGNEAILSALTVKNELEELKTGVASMENHVKGATLAGSMEDKELVLKQMSWLEQQMQQLRTLGINKELEPKVTVLEQLILSHLAYHRSILDSAERQGEWKAEQMLSDPAGRMRSDSIRLVAGMIDIQHEKTVTNIITEADRNGLRAKTLSTVMAIIAAIAAMTAFGYAAYKVRQQQGLIQLLNESESRARKAAQVKERFLANMSHEIRTPLNAIIGFTELLRKKKLDPESSGFIDTISSSGKNLLGIVNDILDLSKLEAGMMTLEQQPFVLKDQVENVERIFSNKAAEKGIDWKVELDENIPQVLVGDAQRLNQILINLAGNAFKFTERGQVQLKVIRLREDSGKVWVAMSVSDTGIGIPAEKMHSIFERFSQAEEHVTRRYGGTGLGLSIVRDLVECMGGDIRVNSEPRQGSTFSILLPFLIHQAEVVSILREEENQILRMKVLVVEDNTVNQKLMEHLLSGWGLDFRIVGDGRDAAGLLQEEVFDVVLMDIQMPGMDGYTAAARIRNELNLSVPIIAMTAHALEGEKEKCLRSGMNGYISKPIDQHMLLSELNKWRPNLKGGHFRYIDTSYLEEVSGGIWITSASWPLNF